MFWSGKKEPVDLNITAAKERLRQRMPWLNWKDEDRRDFLILLCSEQQLSERVHELNLKNFLLIQSVIALIKMYTDPAEPMAKPSPGRRAPGRKPKVKAKPA